MSLLSPTDYKELTIDGKLQKRVKEIVAQGGLYDKNTKIINDSAQYTMQWTDCVPISFYMLARLSEKIFFVFG
mgnify:CR=1 FL=1